MKNLYHEDIKAILLAKINHLNLLVFYQDKIELIEFDSHWIYFLMLFGKE